MTDVTMPRLSDSMEEGTILRWIKGDGEHVERGDEIVEVETDKANMPYEADTAGVLHVLRGEGDTVAVGEVIARIGEPGEESEPALEPAAVVAAGTPAPATHTPREATNGGQRSKASPLARRVAAALSVDLGTLTGSGHGGRIVRADVEAVAAPPAAVAPAQSEEPAPTGAKGGAERVELTRLQQTVARRMSEAKATVPEFTVSVDVEIEQAIAVRTRLKELATDDLPAPSFNDMVVKAAALALREFPRANGSFRDGAFELHDHVNVGVAVATDDALVVPTVFDADRKGLGQIAADTRRLSAAVREGTVTPPELAGGTFTVSNLGMLGVDSFTAVINIPQAAILAVGAMAPRAVVRDGKPVARQTMTMTLTCDHRILYGADAARLAGRIRALLESPLAMLL